MSKMKPKNKPKKDTMNFEQFLNEEYFKIQDNIKEYDHEDSGKYRYNPYNYKDELFPEYPEWEEEFEDDWADDVQDELAKSDDTDLGLDGEGVHMDFDNDNLQTSNEDDYTQADDDESDEHGLDLDAPADTDNLPSVESNFSKKDNKVVILNSAFSQTGEDDMFLNHTLESLKEKCTELEVEEVKLYQLNIQAVSEYTDSEPMDGMVQVYEAIENADVVVLAGCLKKGQLKNLMNSTIERIVEHYKEKELRNKIFSCVIVGEESYHNSIRERFVTIALDLGMILGSDCFVMCENGEECEADISTAAICMEKLTMATKELRSDITTNDESDNIMTFDTFMDSGMDMSEFDEEGLEDWEADVADTDDSEEEFNDESIEDIESDIEEEPSQEDIEEENIEEEPKEESDDLETLDDLGIEEIEEDEENVSGFSFDQVNKVPKFTNYVDSFEFNGSATLPYDSRKNGSYFMDKQSMSFDEFVKKEEEKENKNNDTEGKA